MSDAHTRLAGCIVSFCLCLVAACSRPSAPEAKKDPVVEKKPPPPAPSPISTPSAVASCNALVWDADKMNAAKATFGGVISEGMGGLPNGTTETYYVLTLDKASCDPEGAPVPEIQVYDDTNDFKAYFHKHVRIEGEPFAEFTAHHHRPIVVLITKLAVD